MNIYLAGPIFTERDRMFNSYLEKEILKECPDVNLYLAQNNMSINDKKGCANSADIYVGDVRRLKAADMVITIMSGDMPPIGSSYECAYYTSLCEQDENKCIVALYDDSREGMNTYSEAKKDAMISGIAENQWSYINLLAVGFVKKFGEICYTSQQFIETVIKKIKIFQSPYISGIYRITNLKNGLSYIGQSVDLHQRKVKHWNPQTSKPNQYTELHQDMLKLGLEYFKFEILEKCPTDQLDEREKYWIAYYDTLNNGYNKTSGGHGDKTDTENAQTVRVYAYNLDGSLAKEYISIGQAIRDCGLKSNNITRCIQYNDNEHISGNYMWRLEKYDHIEPYQTRHIGKKVFAYDPVTREFVKAYDNVTDAGYQLVGHRNSHINDCAVGTRMITAGFMWAYEYYDRLPMNYHEQLKLKQGD